MDGASIGLLIAVIVVGIGSVGLSSLYLSLRRQLKQHDPSNTNLQLQSLAKKTNDFNIQYTDLVFGTLLGKGSQGEVYRATWRGLNVAAKKIDTRVVEAEIVEEFVQETDIMRRLRHPNLTLFLGVSLQSPHLCIVTEIVNRGSLFDLMHDEHSALTWSRCLRIATDVAQGMVYLHSMVPQILHRDLKSLNILVDENWRGKVADFGMSRLNRDDNGSMTQCGSPLWMSPEMIRNIPYDSASDVYSFGICLWEMYVRKIPYRELGLNPNNLVVKVVKENLRPIIPKQCPRPYAKLMERCWHPQMEKRPTFLQILKVLESFLQDPLIVNHKPMSSREAIARDQEEQQANAAANKVEVNVVEMNWKVDKSEVTVVNSAPEASPPTTSRPPTQQAAAGDTAANSPVVSPANGRKQDSGNSTERTSMNDVELSEGPTVYKLPRAQSKVFKNKVSPSFLQNGTNSTEDKGLTATDSQLAINVNSISGPTVSTNSVMLQPAPSPSHANSNKAHPPLGVVAGHHVSRTSIYQLEQQEKEALWEARKTVVLKDAATANASTSNGTVNNPPNATQLLSAAYSSATTPSNQLTAGSMLKQIIQRNTIDGLQLATYRGKHVALKRLPCAAQWFEMTHEQRVAADLAGDSDGPLWSLVRKSSELRHPNIVLFMGAYQDMGVLPSGSPAATTPATTEYNPPASNKPQSQLVVVQEYMERGCLADIVLDNSLVLDWDTTLNLIIDAAQGLTYLHACQPTVIHQDLTLRRLFVDKHWRVKISEYGFTDLQQALLNKPIAGSKYTAPELLANPSAPQTTASNIYSFALVLWQIMTRKPIFAEHQRFDSNLTARIIHEGYRPKFPTFISPAFKQLVEQMWQHDAAKRPSFDTVLDTMKQIKADGPPRLLLDSSNATLYQKSKTVFAWRSKDSLTVLKDWGQSVGKNGCTVIFSENDDIYCIAETEFHSNYEVVDTGRHIYRKVGCVFAKCMEDSFAVKTLQGNVEHGLAGDYLVQNEQKEQWSIEAQTFHTLYAKVATAR